MGLGRSLARSVRRALEERSPDRVRAALRSVTERVEALQTRVEDRRREVLRVLDELVALEKEAFEQAIRVLALPWATAGAIRELYGRIRALERTAEERERTLRALEARLAELERRG